MCLLVTEERIRLLSRSEIQRLIFPNKHPTLRKSLLILLPGFIDPSLDYLHPYQHYQYLNTHVKSKPFKAIAWSLLL